MLIHLPLADSLSCEYSHPFRYLPEKYLISYPTYKAFSAEAEFQGILTKLWFTLPLIENSLTVVYSMHMDTSMHSPWYMGYLIWFELAFFCLLTVITLVFLMQCRLHRSASSTHNLPRLPKQKWNSIPELQILMFGLPLMLLWEVAQFPLYTIWHEGDWSYILYGLVHCTLGDLLILIVAYWVVALLNHNRYWLCFPKTHITLNQAANRS